MPLYDYKCTNDECGDIHTKMVSLSGKDEYEATTKCSKCGSPIRQVLSAPAVVSGSGSSQGKKQGSTEFRDILRKMKKNHPGSTMKVD